MSLMEGTIGNLGRIARKLVTSIRLGAFGEQVTAPGRGKYGEPCENGEIFLAANSATQALSVNSATATGIILTNPAGSGVRAEILDVCVSLASLPAGQSSLILTGAFYTAEDVAVVHTTPLTVRCSLLGSEKKAACLADSAATIPTPAIVRVLGGAPAATVATSTAFPPFIRDEISGLLVLEPNTVISLQALTTAMTVVASITWREIPLE